MHEDWVSRLQGNGLAAHDVTTEATRARCHPRATRDIRKVSASGRKRESVELDSRSYFAEKISRHSDQMAVQGRCERVEGSSHWEG